MKYQKKLQELKASRDNWQKLEDELTKKAMFGTGLDAIAMDKLMNQIKNCRLEKYLCMTEIMSIETDLARTENDLMI